jgi:DNA replication protein DnaC
MIELKNIIDTDFLTNFEHIEVTVPEIKSDDLEYKFKSLSFWQQLTDIEKHIIIEQKIKLGIKPISAIYAGASGIGKTTQTILLMNALIRDTAKNEYYVANPEFLGWVGFKFVKHNRICELVNLKKFGTDEQKASSSIELEDLKEAKYLIIDDFSCRRSGSKSDYLDNELDKFMQDLFEQRYGKKDTTLTILTTNETLAQFKDANYSYLSLKTVSRILGAVNSNYYESKKVKDLRYDNN